jgi:cell wall-associated NlpC family hydrolase
MIINTGHKKTFYLALFAFVFLSALLRNNTYSQPGYIATDYKSLSIPADTIKKSVSDSIAVDSAKIDYKEALIDSIIKFGKNYLGKPYRYHISNTRRFDCSGYVSFIFSKFGYSLPPSSSGMAYVGEKISKENARKGDLILFKGRSTKSSRVGHVALIIDVDDKGIVMMHSSSRGILIEHYANNDYYKRRYVMCRRLKL